MDDGTRGAHGVQIRLVGAWLLVGLPLAWGVCQVFQKSLALFR